MVLGLKPKRKLDTPRAQVLDRTKVLHGPRTQTYGETRHSHSLSARQNQGLAWSLNSNLRETSNFEEGLSLGRNGGLVWSSAPRPYGN